MTLDELQSLCEKATPGPWEERIGSNEYDNYYQALGPQHWIKYEPEDSYGDYDGKCERKAHLLAEMDAKFIAAAREYMLQLIERVRELEDKELRNDPYYILRNSAPTQMMYPVSFADFCANAQKVYESCYLTESSENDSVPNE